MGVVVRREQQATRVVCVNGNIVDVAPKANEMASWRRSSTSSHCWFPEICDWCTTEQYSENYDRVTRRHDPERPQPFTELYPVANSTGAKRSKHDHAHKQHSNRHIQMHEKHNMKAN
jgi:hypothetical protein